MKLLELRSDNDKFRTISFNSGLTVIAGLQKSSNKSKTYNGVGKSSSLNLVHLLLGAKLSNKTVRDKKVSNFLKSYGTFFLTFNHKGTDYRVEKNFAETTYLVNGKKYSNQKYNDFLNTIFLDDNKFKKISFRQVLNCFARRYGDKYYTEAHTQQGMPNTDYNQRLANLTLLGLNTSLVSKKQKVKKSIDNLRQSQKAVNGLVSQDDFHNVKDLKEQLSELVRQKETFEISSAFDEERKQTELLTIKLDHLRNDLYTARKEISRKRNLLNQISDVDINLEQLTSVYEEAKLFFEKDVTVYLEDACFFHQKLLKDRTSRLSEEISSLSDIIQDIKIQLMPIEEKRDVYLKNLDSSGAFEEYESVTKQVLIKTTEINTIESNYRLTKNIEEKLTNEKLRNAAIQADALAYLNSISSQIEKLENNFRSIVKRFYKGNGGYLAITLSKDAQYLYDLDIHIPRDGSQGINEVRVFCYDLLLFTLNRELLGFIAHDGCIFSELDHRQKAMMFKLVLEYISDYGLQYFVNIGQSSLDEVLSSDILSTSEKNEIRNSVKLTLLDDGPSSWLFGEQFG